MYTRFIGVGDTFKAEKETYHFHRGMTYLVSHVFNDNGKFRIFFTDKFGNDVEYKAYYFEPTAKTVTLSDGRQKRAKLDFLWNNSNSKFVIRRSYNDDDKEYISFNKYSVYSYEYSGPTADISRSTKNTRIDGSKATIRSKEELYDYFKALNVETEKITIDGVFYSNQEDIDHVQYMLSLPTFDENLLKLPETLKLEEINQYVHSTKPKLDVFLKLIAEVIFDEDSLSPNNKKIVNNVVEAYEVLPKSYGPTAVAKLIMGKEKKKNQTVEHLSGTAVDMKQSQAFTLADIIESFMYINNVFVTKEDYSSGTEWRGAFEFIGSKMINQDELTKIKNELK